MVKYFNLIVWSLLITQIFFAVIAVMFLVDYYDYELYIDAFSSAAFLIFSYQCYSVGHAFKESFFKNVKELNENDPTEGMNRDGKRKAKHNIDRKVKKKGRDGLL